ncbi:MAG: hypothetical protein FH756_02455 [Firmicutes bacterium]|nr:hypothetical protein [Bacillota bacterium]
MFDLDMVLLKALIFLLILIVVDVILGMAIAIKKKQFELEKLPQFLYTEVLPYYMSTLALAGLAMVEDVQGFGTKPIAWAVVVAYGSKLIFIEIRQKVTFMFGIKIPKKTIPK